MGISGCEKMRMEDKKMGRKGERGLGNEVNKVYTQMYVCIKM